MSDLPLNTRPAGRSRTAPQAPGKTVPVLQPEDKNYLCQKICYCRCNAKLGKVSQFLYQRCVTASIRRDCEANAHVWLYKGEVGYNMRMSPPRPLLGKNGIHPSTFPLGAAYREEVYSLSKIDLEAGPQRGLLRIPDVVIVKDKSNFSLEQPNIAVVVEIKFPGDRLLPGQEQAYKKIAGNERKFKLLEFAECDCKPCDDKQERRQPQTVPKPFVAPIPEIKPGRRTVGQPVTVEEVEGSVPVSTYLLAGGLIVGAIAIEYFSAGTGTAVAASALSAACRLFVVGAAASTAGYAAAQNRPGR